MGYKCFGRDVGPLSPLFRLKDFASTIMGWIDLVSDAVTAKKYKDDCDDESSGVPCTYFYLNILFICLPSIAVTIIMLGKGGVSLKAFMYGIFYPIWGPWKRMCMMLPNLLICFVDGENDEATRAIADEIALPEVVFEAVPQVKINRVAKFTLLERCTFHTA